MRFLDRVDAGQQLAARLAEYREKCPVVLGMPRGGVPVAVEVAKALGAPLDVWVSRKIGAPSQPELGLGAISEDGTLYLDRPAIADLGVSREEIGEVVKREAIELARRVARFRQGRERVDVQGRTVILVDDGVATGGTAHAAAASIRAQHPAELILAVPVAATSSLEALRSDFDDIVCIESSNAMWAIGAWYEDFAQVADAEVIALLEAAQTAAAPAVVHRQ